MTPDDRARLEAISDALARMVRRQNEIEQRLRRMEEALAAAGWIRSGLERQDEPAAAAARYAVADAPVEAPAAPARIVEESPPPPLPPAEPRPGVESVFGLTWISRIGALTLIIGVAFFFKYAFENRWITETGRVLLGIGISAAALGLGERFSRTGQRIYAQSLTAAGVAFLYLSIWSAFALYHLIGRSSAFLLMAVTTAGAGALAIRYAGGAIAAIGLAGGFLTPLLLETGRDPWFVLGYTLLLAAGGLWMARRWRRLQVLNFVGTVALYATQWANPIPAGERLLYTLFTFALYAVFAAGPITVVVVLAQCAAALAVMGISEPDAVALAPLVVITAGGLVAADRRGSAWLAAGAFGAFWFTYAAWWGEAGTRSGVWGPFAWLTIAFLVFLGWPLYRRLVRDLPLRLTEFALVGLNAAASFGAGYWLFQPGYARYVGFFAVALALVHMLVAALMWRRDIRGALLAAGAAWAFLVLAAPIQFTGYRVTMAWSLEAAALAWTGRRLRDERASWAALGVFVMAFVRLLVVDSWMYPTVTYTALFNARFLTFAVSTAAVWAVAWWTRDGLSAATAWLAGHFILIWALCLEVTGWVARTAAVQNVASAQSAGISILMALYAVAMVAGGVIKGSPLTRIAGIALIGFVVLKLYLYDVWLLRLFYRMAAFAVLGVLLLSTSYLYSRFRDKIGSWWRPGE